MYVYFLSLSDFFFYLYLFFFFNIMTEPKYHIFCELLLEIIWSLIFTFL